MRSVHDWLSGDDREADFGRHSIVGRKKDMNVERGLASLAVGEVATVVRISHEGGLQRRLLDLGFLVGAPVRCIGKSPLGDPKAYWIRQTVIALRAKDAQFVIVK